MRQAVGEEPPVGEPGERVAQRVGRRGRGGQHLTGRPGEGHPAEGEDGEDAAVDEEVAEAVLVAADDERPGETDERDRGRHRDGSGTEGTRGHA